MIRWLLAATLLALVACAPATTPAPADLPLPDDLAQLDRPVQRLFEQRHEALDRVLSAGDSTPRQLAHAFGAVGEIHFAYDSLDLAEQAFESATRLEPGEPRWHYLLARVRQNLGRLDEAEAGLARVLELDPGHVPSLSVLADLVLERGDTARARKLFTEVLRLDPTHVRARAGMAILALDRGDPETALEHLREGLARQPAAAPLHYQAALAYRALGDEEAARRHFERVPTQNVTHVQLIVEDPWMRRVDQLRIGARHHDQRAMRALAAGRFQLAVVELRQALAADPDRIYARHGLGVALSRLGRVEEALAELRTLMEQAPDHVPTLVLTASLLVGRGELEEAGALLEKALETSPGDEEALRQQIRWQEAVDARRPAAP